MLTREEVERIEATLKRNLEDFEVHGGMVRYWVSINDAKRLLREYQAVVDERDALAADGRLLKVAEAAVDVIDGCPYKGVLDFPELRAALDDWRNNDSI